MSPRRFRLYPRAFVAHGALMRNIVATLALAAMLCGCATTKPQMDQPPYLQVLSAQKIDPGTYARISRGRVLGYDDLLDLVQRGVPGRMIVPYLKATRTPYKYSARQINALVNAGADDVLVDYLGKAAGIYMQDAGNVPSSAGGARSALTDPYFADPYFMGPAPFGFAYPEEWY